MAAVQMFKRPSSGRPIPAGYVEGTDDAILSSLVRTSSGAATLFNDTFTSALTIGGGATAAGAGTSVSIQGGDPATATAAGGAITATGGDGNTTGAGGALTFTGGLGGATDASVGGAVTIASGSSAATNGDSGNVSMDAGAATGSGTAGTLTLGGTNASAVQLGNTGGATTVTGAGVNLAGGSSEIDITTTGALDVNSGATTVDCSTFDLTATGALSIDSSSTIAIGDTSTTAITLGRAAITVTIPGNLVVQGTTTSVDNENLQTSDNHIYLNKDYTAVAAQTGGLALNYLPTATTDTSTTGGFATTTTVNTTGAATFSAGDFVQVSGSANPANDGIYEVSTHAANVLTINGTPTHRFCNTAFTVDTGDTTATFTHVNISVIQSGTDGVWEQGIGNTAAGLTSSLSDLATAAGATLQTAYEAGNTIVTDGGNGAFDVSGTEAISLDAGASSNFSVAASGATLTLAATGGGANQVVVNSAGTGASAIDLNATAGGITLDAAGALSFDGVGASNLTVDTGNLTISTTTSGTLALTSVAALDLDGTAVTIDGTSGVSIDGSGAASNLTSTGQALSVRTVTSGALDVTSAGTLDVDAAAAISINSSGGVINVGDDAVAQAINVGTGAAARTITVGNNTGATTIALEAGSGGLDVDADGDSAWTLWDWTVTLNETQTADSGTAGNPFSLTTGIGAAAGGTTDGGNGGSITLTTGAGGAGSATNAGGDGGDISLVPGAGGATGGAGAGLDGRLLFTSGGTSYPLTASGVAGPALTTTAQTIIEAINEVQAASSSSSTVSSTWTTTGLTVGAPVYVSGTDTVSHGDASAESTSEIIGLVSTVGASGLVVTHGPTTAVFAGGDSGFAAGDPVYLSTTTGRCTFTAPSGAGDTVIQIGYLKDATGLSATTVDGETAEIMFNVGPRIGPLA